MINERKLTDFWEISLYLTHLIIIYHYCWKGSHEGVDNDAGRWAIRKDVK